MSKKIIYFLALFFSLSVLAFTACSSDDDPVELKLEKSEITVVAGASETVMVSKGNGTYTAVSSSDAKATVVVKDGEVVITGVSAGDATVTVTDKEKKTATIKVTVTTLASSIAGTYNGDLVITIVGEPEPVEVKKDIILKSIDKEEKVELLLKDFQFGEVPVGDITITGIAVSKVGDAVNLADTKASLSLKMGEVPMTADASLKNTSVKLKSPTVTKETAKKPDIYVLTMNIDVDNVKLGELPLGQEITITFAGDKK